jgi:Holliday junction resolvase-like predicted endonuclease
MRKFRIYHSFASGRDPYDLMGIRVEPNASGWDLILREKTEGSRTSRSIRDIPRVDVTMIEEDPDEDLSSAIAEYRRFAAILIDPPPPEQQQQLKNLQERYERMQRLDGYTAQSRGQRLNGLVADVLRSWGIDAIESTRSYGEVDVAFALGGDLFVMEAKWKQDPINSDPIAKLQRRVEQRLTGTLGLFLSMSGYTRPAVTEINIGERLTILLLDKHHLEALLLGETSPQKLLAALRSRASFYGAAYTAWSAL